MTSIRVPEKQYTWLRRKGGSASDRVRCALDRWQRGELGDTDKLNAVIENQENSENRLFLLPIQFNPEFPNAVVRAIIELAMDTPMTRYDDEIKNHERFITSYLAVMNARTITDPVTGERYIENNDH